MHEGSPLLGWKRDTCNHGHLTAQCLGRFSELLCRNGGGWGGGGRHPSYVYFLFYFTTRMT